MIDMSNLYNHPEYSIALELFNTNKKWSEFKGVHMMVTNNKCPICECSLDGSLTRSSAKQPTTTITPTIDHYRPKGDKYYPKLKFDHKNYILMCSDCNNPYKGCKFPLHSSTPTPNTRALKTEDITNENPLIINPIYDKPNDFFKLNFRQTLSGKKVLELIAKNTDPYQKEKAEETIKLFSLGKCEDINHMHKSSNVQNCRIGLLHSHFNKFHKLITILNGRKLEDISIEDQKKVYLLTKNFNLQHYGFYYSIMENNYNNLTP